MTPKQKAERNKKIHYVYVLKYKNEELYIGLTIDPQKRLKQHQATIKHRENKLLVRYCLDNNISYEDIKMEIVYVGKKDDVQKYECYLILKRYFDKKVILQSLPKTISYYQ